MTGSAHTLQTVEIADRLQRVVAQFARLLRRGAVTELTPSQVSMLGTIWKFDGCRIGELATREAVSNPVATRVVASLEAHGLVAREADAQDGRASRAHITEAGQAALLEFRRVRGQVLQEYLTTLTDEELELLARVLPLLENLAGR